MLSCKFGESPSSPHFKMGLTETHFFSLAQTVVSLFADLTARNSEFSARWTKTFFVNFLRLSLSFDFLSVWTPLWWPSVRIFTFVNLIFNHWTFLCACLPPRVFVARITPPIGNPCSKAIKSEVKLDCCLLVRFIGPEVSNPLKTGCVLPLAVGVTPILGGSFPRGWKTRGSPFSSIPRSAT